MLPHPNTWAVELAKNLEALPPSARDFIQNPGSQDHLSTALTDCVLAGQRPSMAKASGQTRWAEVSGNLKNHEVEEMDPLAAAPANPIFGSRKREFPGKEVAPKKKVALFPKPVITFGYAEWGLVDFAAWAEKLEGGIPEALGEKGEHAAILEAVRAQVRAEFGLPATYVRESWIQANSEHVKQLQLVLATVLGRQAETLSELEAPKAHMSALPDLQQFGILLRVRAPSVPSKHQHRSEPEPVEGTQEGRDIARNLRSP